MLCGYINCKKEFSIIKSNQLYCNNQCRNKASVKRYRIKNKKLCPICINKFIYKESNMCNFCTLQNRNTKQLVDWSKVTLGDVRKLRKYQLHSRIRTLSRNIYLRSEKPKFCIICKYNIHFEVCHVKSIDSFKLDTPISVINNLDNLIALCRNHHWEFDNKLLIL